MLSNKRTIQLQRGNFHFAKTSTTQRSNFTRSFHRSIPKLDDNHDSNKHNKVRILITGCLGQIGTELSTLLRRKYGEQNVIGSDIQKPSFGVLQQGPFVYLDVTDYHNFARVVVEHNIHWIIHNSSILSAAGERNPQLAKDINITGLHNAFDVASKYNLRMLAPSSIAAFGPSSPRDNTPDLTIQRPTTFYGISKVYLELLGEWYAKRGLDFRSLRYPGIISSETLPGGGTTDYAVEIFYEALKHGKYTSFLDKDTLLPMMYMPDCLKATVQMIETPANVFSQNVYNVTGFSFTPAQLAEAIKKYIPNFQIDYQPDFRQKIADSWPKSLDDSKARKDWGWSPKYDLDSMVKDMLIKLRAKLLHTDPNLKLKEIVNLH